MELNENRRESSSSPQKACAGTSVFLVLLLGMVREVSALRERFPRGSF
jgi:hypothetical protein